MKVLIVGGTRFLGIHIAEDLCRRGHVVELLNRATRPTPDCASRLYTCDVKDRPAFSAILKEGQWDVVIDTIMSDADLEFAVPLLDKRIQQFLHTGSVGVYGGVNRIPARECENLVEHDATYQFNGKLREDNVLMNAFNDTGFPATSLRASCIYGPGDVPLDGWGGRSVYFFELLRDGAEIPIAGWGNYLLHAGHVHDLGRAFGDAMENPISIGRIYNIAGPFAMTVNEYVKDIAEAMGVAANIKHVDPDHILKTYSKHTKKRGLDILCQHMCCDTRRAKDDLNWSPAISFKDGIAENLDWMSTQGMI
jgi:nucleoside-diphosphate-sugar epimerase